MSRSHLLVLASLSLVAAGVCAAPAPAAEGRHSLSGGRVHIYNLAGTVEVVPGPGTSVVVQSTTGGRDAAQIDVKTLAGADPALVFTYPGRKIVYRRAGSGWMSKSRTTLDVGADGRFGDGWGRNGLGLGRRKVEIRSDGDGLQAWADLKIAVPRGQKASVHQGVGDVTVSNVDGELRIDCASGSVEAGGTKGWLDIDTGSGSVTIRDAADRVSVDTGSGNVSLLNFSGTEVLVDTGSGSVKLGSVRATGRVGVDTGSGRVEIIDVRSPKVGVDTGSGRVFVSLGADIDELAIDTGSGSVTVEAPGTLDATVQMETGSGGLQVDGFSMSSISRDSGSLSGRIGNGRGRILLETGSGRIRLAKV